MQTATSLQSSLLFSAAVSSCKPFGERLTVLEPLCTPLLLLAKPGVPFAGEDEREEQAGPSLVGHHQGVCDACGRTDQGGAAGVAADDRQALGGFAQKLHSGKLLVQENKHHPLH